MTESLTMTKYCIMMSAPNSIYHEYMESNITIVVTVTMITIVNIEITVTLVILKTLETFVNIVTLAIIVIKVTTVIIGDSSNVYNP